MALIPKFSVGQIVVFQALDDSQKFLGKIEECHFSNTNSDFIFFYAITPMAPEGELEKFRRIINVAEDRLSGSPVEIAKIRLIQ